MQLDENKIEKPTEFPKDVAGRAAFLQKSENRGKREKILRNLDWEDRRELEAFEANKRQEKFEVKQQANFENSIFLKFLSTQKLKFTSDVLSQFRTYLAADLKPRLEGEQPKPIAEPLEDPPVSG